MARSGAPASTDRGEPERRPAGRLEDIIERLDSGQAELRETLDLVSGGKQLIEFCKSELDSVSGELRELKLDELIASLDTASAEQAEERDSESP